jgi:hypothetical protein
MSRIRRAYHDPDAERHPVPTYWWKGAPAGLATRRQLRKAGLAPGGQDIVAQILWSGVGGERVAYLYEVARAVKKRTATPAQLVAVEKALAARRTCSTCGQVRPYYIPRKFGECLDCVPTTVLRAA